jgi:hypothetical protein
MDSSEVIAGSVGALLMTSSIEIQPTPFVGSAGMMIRIRYKTFFVLCMLRRMFKAVGSTGKLWVSTHVVALR